eukprot:8875536-Pyramimonas_sp.AAC.1
MPLTLSARFGGACVRRDPSLASNTRNTKSRAPDARRITKMQLDVKKGGVASAIVAGSLAGDHSTLYRYRMKH